MVVLLVYPYHRKTWLQTLKEEKEANKKEPHQDRKKISRFLKVDYLMERQQDFRLQFFLKIKIYVAKIIQNKEVFQDPDMQTGWPIKSLVAMKIIAVAGILVQD